jgi:hypothetical protein
VLPPATEPYVLRYIFDFHDGHATDDDEGVEFPTRQHAIRAAGTELVTYAAECLLAGRRSNEFNVTVRSETGQPVCMATMTLRQVRF